MAENIVQQGVELMLFGMGTVVVFLTLLVLATSGMSALVQRFFPEPVELTPRPAPTLPGSPADPRLAAVISAAVHHHRQHQSR